MTTTPGPWTIPPDDPEGQRRTAVEQGLPPFPGRAVVGPDGKSAIAVVLTLRPESEADGRLIAAAPELLAAVQGAIEAIHFTREYVGEERLPAIEGWSWYDSTLQLKAAVAKATEGEQK